MHTVARKHPLLPVKGFCKHTSSGSQTPSSASRGLQDATFLDAMLPSALSQAGEIGEPLPISMRRHRPLECHQAVARQSRIRSRLVHHVASTPWAI